MTFQEKGDQEHSKLNNMKRQRNIQQIRDHGKNPQDQINEDKIGKLPEKKKIRVMIIKMIQNLKNRMEKII